MAGPLPARAAHRYWQVVHIVLTGLGMCSHRFTTFLFIISAIALGLLGTCELSLAQNEFDFHMSSPVNCDALDLCFVQNYVDQKDGPQWQDYTCGPLSYDGHTGTDIRVSYEDMLRGVPVRAVADGIVIQLRDGMEDVSLHSADKAPLRGRNSGNVVYIDHNGGYESQYSHLKKGSISVRKGDVVRRGQVIGMVGLSGKTVFPHVELSVSVSGKPIDPFLGERVHGCNAAGQPLWDEDAQRMLAYQPHGALGAAFVNGIPNLKTVLLRPKRPFYPGLGNRMTFWAAMFGVREGDLFQLSITGPSGKVLTQRDETVSSNLAQKISGVSVVTKQSWPPGNYVGRCVLTPVGPGEPITITRTIHVPSSR